MQDYLMNIMQLSYEMFVIFVIICNFAIWNKVPLAYSKHKFFYRQKQNNQRMRDKWNEFVYDLREAQNRNAEESEYHYIIESQLKVLGWLKSKGEICHKANIPIGNNNFIQPDILINREGLDLFVIEVKRPIHTQTERERQQLVSYMRQLKLMIGIYIGEYIEVFYDKPGSQDVESILKVELKLDATNGEQFVSLFDRNQFEQDKVVSFCEKQLKRMEQERKLASFKEQLLTNGDSIIKQNLKLYLGRMDDFSFSENSIDEMLLSLRFSVNSKSDTQNEETEVPTYNTANILSENSSKKDTGYDYTKYVLNGSYPLGKNEFVLAVVKEYIKLHPEKTYDELEDIFKPQLQLGGNRIDSPKKSNGLGVIRSLDFIRQKGYEGKRYHEEVLQSADHIPFKVCTQWGIENIGNIVELANRLGFKVQVL